MLDLPILCDQGENYQNTHVDQTLTNTKKKKKKKNYLISKFHHFVSNLILQPPLSLQTIKTTLLSNYFNPPKTPKKEFKKS